MKSAIIFCRGFCSKPRFVCHLTDDRKKVKLSLKQGVEENRAYHGIWLRHNCRCPQCFSSSTNMLKLSVSQVYNCKEMESARIQGADLLVKWVNSDHEGVFPLEWLKDNDYSSEERRRERHKAQQPLIADSFPVNDFTDIISSDEGTYKWLKNINYYGVSLIKGIEAPETASAKLATKFPHLLYGEIYDVIHKEDIDDLGEGVSELQPHQDYLYYENPPGIQVFNCLRNDPCVKGGESVIVDLYPIVEELRTNYPESFKILTTTPVSFQRNIMGSYEQFYLRMTRHHIELDRFGQVVGINWNPAHRDPLCVEEEIVESYYEAIFNMEKLIMESKLKLYHRLVPGECLVFNNRRMVHGRSRFYPNGGKRHFDGFYVHTDYLRSQFLVLGKKLGKNEHSANVFMNSR